MARKKNGGLLYLARQLEQLECEVAYEQYCSRGALRSKETLTITAIREAMIYLASVLKKVATDSNSRSSVRAMMTIRKNQEEEKEVEEDVDENASEGFAMGL